MRTLALLFMLSFAGCTAEDEPASDTSDEADTDTHSDAGTDSETDADSDTVPADASILSAYYGLDELPAAVALLCGAEGVGQDGMPVVFSVQLDDDSVSPEVFAVETAAGDIVTPVCATLRPAVEPLELRTVLLAGDFGTPDAQPRAVEVVGALQDLGGRALQGLRTDTITPLEAGPSLVLAQRFDPATVGLAGECPTDTIQVVQMTWEGGVSGPEGSALHEPQRTAVSVTLDDGSEVTPTALADDDPDNIVHACLDTSRVPQSISVAAGFFYDPGDDPNPSTSIEVVHGD
jgi:hypothetical protein